MTNDKMTNDESQKKPQSTKSKPVVAVPFGIWILGIPLAFVIRAWSLSGLFPPDQGERHFHAQQTQPGQQAVMPNGAALAQVLEPLNIQPRRRKKPLARNLRT